MMNVVRYLHLLPLALALSATSLSQPVSGHNLAPVTMAAATVSESSAVAAALRAVKGRVLSVQLIESRGPPVYRVKILTENGRVRTVHVDGHTGEVISF